MLKFKVKLSKKYLVVYQKTRIDEPNTIVPFIFFSQILKNEILKKKNISKNFEISKCKILQIFVDCRKEHVNLCLNRIFMNLNSKLNPL